MVVTAVQNLWRRWLGLCLCLELFCWRRYQNVIAVCGFESPHILLVQWEPEARLEASWVHLSQLWLDYSLQSFSRPQLKFIAELWVTGGSLIRLDSRLGFSFIDSEQGRTMGNQNESLLLRFRITSLTWQRLLGRGLWSRILMNLKLSAWRGLAQGGGERRINLLQDLSVEECSSWLGQGRGCPNDDIELAY